MGIKQHKKNEFYYKKLRNGMFAVYDGYDHSVASVEFSEKEANRLCDELNEIRNTRLNLK